MKNVNGGRALARRPRGWTWALTSLVIAACGGEAGPPTEAAEAVHATESEGFVMLDSAAAATVGLEVVEAITVGEGTLSATGTVLYDQNRVSHVGPRAEGRIVRIERDLGDRVEEGAALAVLESPELGEAEAEHARAQAELRLAQDNYEREQGLFEKGISSRKEMLEARTEFERARATLGAATARHRTLGALDHPDDSVRVEGLYTVAAPIRGTVVERNLVLGQIVGPDDDLFTVADLTRLWLILDIYDLDVARVREGLEVEVSAAAFPGAPFRGTLTYVGQIVDSLTRTVKARVVVENPERRLRPGMFATAVIRGLDAGNVVAVPEASVQRLDERTVVFVPAGDGRFEVREVVTNGPVGDGLVSVLEGLAAGERVVSEGSFYLKSELLKGSSGGDAH